MQDITEHIMELQSIRLAEDIIFESESNHINEKFEVGAGTMDDLEKLSPWELRKYVVGFYKSLFEKTGMDKTNKGVYDDMNVWNITKYPAHIQKVILKGSKKTEKHTERFVKVLKPLHDFSDYRTNKANEIHSKIGAEVHGEFLSMIKDPELKQLTVMMGLENEDFSNIQYIMVWNDDKVKIDVRDDKYLNEFKVIAKKLFKNPKVTVNKKRPTIIIQADGSKKYWKAMEKLDKQIKKEIKASGK